MNLKKIGSKVWTNIKLHTFQFIVLVAFVTLGFIQIVQNELISFVHIHAQDNHIALNLHKQDNNMTFEDVKLGALEAIDVKGRSISLQISDAESALNSRIDILDSAIKPEKKRRMLVVKIRKAIVENTDTKIPVRTLNNIAIAVIDYGYQYNLSVVKILAQMKQESDFDVRAISRAGAQGLMQIMPETLEYIELKEGKRLNAWNVYHNIRAGCFYMAEQITEFHNFEDALRAYNWGPHYLHKYNAGEISHMPRETEKYVPNIKKWVEVFDKYGLE